MAEDFRSKRDIMKDMLTHIFDRSQLFGRKAGANHGEYIGVVQGIPFQCEPRRTTTYYLFRIDGVYFDCEINSNCVIRTSSNKITSQYVFTADDNYTNISFDMLWRLIHLMADANKYIDIYSRIREMDPNFCLHKVGRLNERFKWIMAEYN